ncbi:hypothetical protein KJ786_01040 [Patescibacteria group bacterium]|nr:hypothetical protein [Patescibacteria group bacterium]
MKNYNLLKIKAIKLRKQGRSYNEIKKSVKVAKSTLSLWLKNIPLSPKHRKRLYTKQISILSKGPQSQKERRIREIAEIIKNAKKEVSNSISLESYRLFGAALYWAEGNKKNGLEITNSDPYLISFIVKWFKKILGVAPKDLKAWLNIYPQQNDLKIKSFWSQLTGIPLENFGKSFVKPLSKNYKKNNLYYGTIKITVPRGTDMRHRIFGWIKVVLQDISAKTELTQQEWKSLEKVSRAINVS